MRKGFLQSRLCESQQGQRAAVARRAARRWALPAPARPCCPKLLLSRTLSTEATRPSSKHVFNQLSIPSTDISRAPTGSNVGSPLLAPGRPATWRKEAADGSTLKSRGQLGASSVYCKSTTRRKKTGRSSPKSHGLDPPLSGAPTKPTRLQLTPCIQGEKHREWPRAARCAWVVVGSETEAAWVNQKQEQSAMAQASNGRIPPGVSCIPGAPVNSAKSSSHVSSAWTPLFTHHFGTPPVPSPGNLLLRKVKFRLCF